MQTTSGLAIPAEVRRDTRRRWRLRGVVALVAVVAAAIVLAVTRPWSTDAPGFRTTAVEKRDITQVVEATGHLDVSHRTDVPALAKGTLLQSLVHDGERVKQGQVLARLDDRAAEIALRSAQASLRSAKSDEARTTAQNKSAGDVLERTLRLSRRGLASDSDVVAARLSAAKARAGLAAARAQHDVAVQNLARARLARNQRKLTAPVAGEILSTPESLGAMVAPGRGPLFVIGSALDSLRIRAWVAEADIGKVRVGQKASFTVPAYPDQTFQAVVRSIGVDADRHGNKVRYLVTLEADNPHKRLLPGMTATLRIEVAHARRVLAVREAALRFNPDGSTADRSRVWRLGPKGALQQVQVRATTTDGAYTEVHALHGDTLDPGDKIVIGRVLPADGAERGPGISLGGH